MWATYSMVRCIGTKRNTVGMVLEGQEARATYDRGPPARLTWDDGSVWRMLDKNSILEGMVAPSLLNLRSQSQKTDVDPRKDLDGSWLEAGNPVCTLRGLSVKWNEILFGKGQSESTLSVKKDGTIELVLEGQSTTAKLYAGPPATLQWSDGAIWTRDELQGVWMIIKQNDRAEPIGVIRDHKVHWDSRFGDSPELLKPCPVMPLQSTSLTVRGVKTTGTFDPGPPAKLTWSDSEVWIRAHFEP
eukprot:TRINITY_DN59436_c0_g1_i1.p2 TRINITY_DN59436_c0_g1~~TRINITY_DN59436_c0_g1_i1.p2  ORF type:complete len:244 (-),score=24.68 TRINITY_DN59436_c0_g1_i1:238-969(-)